jgi:hypothetical protein
MNTMNDEEMQDIAELLKLLKTTPYEELAEAMAEATEQESNSTTEDHTDGFDRELVESWCKVVLPDVQGFRNTCTWQPNIEEDLKELRVIVIAAAAGSVTVMFLIGVALGLILRSGG